MSARPVDRGQQPWNKGLLIGQKIPLEPKHVWSIRVRLEIARSRRDLAIFNPAIDSKLRACDLGRVLINPECPLTWRCPHYPRYCCKSLFGRTKFLEPLMRFASGDVRDHIVSSKTDQG